MFGFALLAVGFAALFSSLVAGLIHYRVRWRPMPAPEPGSSLAVRRGYLVLTESLAYVGTALMVAGGVAAVAERWREITAWEYVEIFLGAAILLFAIGFVVREVTSPPLRRLTAFTWLASACCGGTAAGIAAHGLLGAGGAATTLAVGAAVAAYSAGLWAVGRSEAQMTVMFAGLVAAASGTGLLIGGHGAWWLTASLGLWALGLGWTVLAWRYPEPLWTTLLAGAALALAAPALSVWGHGWVYALAIATAVAAVIAAVAARVRPWSSVLLGLGSAGLLGYVTAAAIRYFRGPLGLPVTLAVTGAFFVALAVASARLRQSKRPGAARRAGSDAPAGPPAGAPPGTAPPGAPGEPAAAAAGPVPTSRRRRAAAAAPKAAQAPPGTGLPKAS